jgi:hypothetical protein
MNRHDRRRAKAKHNNFVEDYVRHLPQVPVDEPIECGGVYHLVYRHDDWCGIYSKPSGTLADCTCKPVVTKHKAPRWS